MHPGLYYIAEQDGILQPTSALPEHSAATCEDSQVVVLSAVAAYPVWLSPLHWNAIGECIHCVLNHSSHPFLPIQ